MVSFQPDLGSGAPIEANIACLFTYVCFYVQAGFSYWLVFRKVWNFCIHNDYITSQVSLNYACSLLFMYLNYKLFYDQSWAWTSFMLNIFVKEHWFLNGARNVNSNAEANSHLFTVRHQYPLNLFWKAPRTKLFLWYFNCKFHALHRALANDIWKLNQSISHELRFMKDLKLQVRKYEQKSKKCWVKSNKKLF